VEAKLKMPISGMTNVTMENLTRLTNVSDLPEFAIQVNNIIYNGMLWFILLIVFFVVLFIILYRNKQEAPLQSLFYASISTTILSFLLRGVTMYYKGVLQGLLTYHQLWIFPIITLLLGLGIMMTRE
jgi:hypothetical protein